MNTIATRCILLNLATVLTLTLGLGSAAAQTEVYRWKDGNGRVHFGDRPDAGDARGAQRVVVPAPNLADGVKARLVQGLTAFVFRLAAVRFAICGHLVALLFSWIILILKELICHRFFVIV